MSFSWTQKFDPASVSEPLQSDDKEHWMDAMKQEMSSIHESDVYELVELPKRRKALNSRWVLKKKNIKQWICRDIKPV